MPIKRLTKIAILGALGTLLMLVSFPIIPGAPFLKYDPGVIPVLLAAFALGPGEAILVLVVKNLLHLILKLTPETMIGIFMNFFMAGSFAISAGLIYRRFHTLKGALIGLVIGIFVMTAFMIPVNILVYPLFLKLVLPGMTVPSSDKLLVFVLATIVPFNLIQGVITSILVFLTYKRISPVLKD